MFCGNVHLLAGDGHSLVCSVLVSGGAARLYGLAMIVLRKSSLADDPCSSGQGRYEINLGTIPNQSLDRPSFFLSWWELFRHLVHFCRRLASRLAST